MVAHIYLDANISNSVRDSISQTLSSLNIILSQKIFHSWSSQFINNSAV